MPVSRNVKFLVLWAAGWVCLFAADTYSDRISCAFNGHPKARIVPKNQLNVFKYVKTDFMRASAIVFEGDTAIGWIYRPWQPPSVFVELQGDEFTLTPRADKEWMTVGTVFFLSTAFLMFAPVLLLLLKVKDWLIARWRGRIKAV